MEYTEIMENLTTEKVEEILNSLNIPYTDKGSFLLLPTVCHNPIGAEASEKLYYYKNNKVFVCYTEDGSMSPFTFLKKYYEVNDMDYDWYSDIYSLLQGTASMVSGNFFEAEKSYELYKPKMKEAEIDLPEVNEHILECFKTYYPVEWLNDGITPAAMDKFNIKYDCINNKIIIPHYSADGKLVGIRGRALNDEDVEEFGKYMPINFGGKWYNHPLSMNLYGYNVNKDNIAKCGKIIIAEGEKSVLQADNFANPNIVVAACGSNLSRHISRIINKTTPFVDEVIIAFDKEDEANVWPRKQLEKIHKMIRSLSPYMKYSVIYDFDNVLKLKESPFDKGEEVFNYLYKNRIKIKE